MQTGTVDSHTNLVGAFRYEFGLLIRDTEAEPDISASFRFHKRAARLIPDRPKVYNSRLNMSVPPRPAGNRDRPDFDSRANANERQANQHVDSQHHYRHATYAAEASGLLIMAVVLLILTVIRYWREIPWSAR